MLALETLKELWDLGYSSHDIISTMFRVTKTIPTLSETFEVRVLLRRLDSHI